MTLEFLNAVYEITVIKNHFDKEEKRSTVLEVEAEKREKALEKAEEAYEKNEVCLNHTDYIDDGTCFYDETETWRECIENGYNQDFQKLS